LFFRIETITIKGDRVYTDKEILLQSGIEVGDSLVGVRESKLNKTLSKNLPYIGEVKIEKKLPDKLIISITATREIVAFQSGSGFILIDAEGKVIDKNASILRENVGVVNGIKPKTVNEGELIGFSDEKTSVAFSTLLTAIKESGLNLITEINFDGSGKWILKYDDRITIKVFADDKIEEKLKLAVRSIEIENARNPYVEGVLDFTKATDGVFGSADETTKPPSTDVSGGVSGETTTSKTE
jgi:cell division protein FtsQ